MKINRFGLKKLFFQYQNLYLVLIAVVIGLASGAGNIIFRFTIDFVQTAFYGTNSEIVLPYFQAAPAYKILLCPTIGGLLVGIIWHLYKHNGTGGVSAVIKALMLKTPISLLSGVVTIITTAITLGSGGSAGREASIVHIGASIGSAIGRLFRFSSTRMSFAIASGSGGAIAATFNTPMAGAMFAAEVLLGRLEFQIFAPVVISCVSATVVSRAYFGDHITFLSPLFVLSSPYELFLYALMGIIVGITGALFIKFFFFTSGKFQKLEIPQWLKPALGGLMLGCLALPCRNIMGVGYGTILDVLTGYLSGWFLLFLVLAKILGTSFTLGSGGAGGIFVPSLYLGATLGGFIGWLADLVFPEMVMFPSSYALVGMGAMLGATMRAPITAIIMIFEITGKYQVVLPLMVATIIAHVCASLLEKESFFTRPLVAEGLNLRHGTEIALLEQVYVKDIMLTDIVIFKDDDPFRKILEDIRKKPHEYFPVVNNDKILKGIISLKDIKQVVFEKEVNELLVAQDFGTREHLLTVTPNDSLAKALSIMGNKDIIDLPVVNSNMKLIGLLRRSDILAVYNKKVLDIMKTS